MNTLMMVVGTFMIAGPVVTVVILKLLSDPHKEPGFIERHGQALLVITTVSATIGGLLFFQGAGWG